MPLTLPLPYAAAAALLLLLVGSIGLSLRAVLPSPVLLDSWHRSSTLYAVPPIAPLTPDEYTDFIDGHLDQRQSFEYEHLRNTSALTLNEHRLLRIGQKLSAGEPLVIGVTGSSNSVGWTLLERSSNVYIQLLHWLHNHYPPTDHRNHTLFNRAVGATTSEFASYCLEDILPSLESVDLLLVDYSVNDYNHIQYWHSPTNEEAVQQGQMHMQVMTNMERLVKRPAATQRSC